VVTIIFVKYQQSSSQCVSQVLCYTRFDNNADTVVSASLTGITYGWCVITNLLDHSHPKIKMNK